MIESVRLSMLLDRARGLVGTVSGRLPFDESFETKASAATLWYELQKAICKSSTSEVWPHEFASVESDGLEPHAVIDVDYKFFFTDTTCQYKVIDVVQGQSFKYRTLKQHFFNGWGDIQIRQTANGSTLNWVGEYQFEKAKSIHALVFRLYFQERFFSKLRDRLAKISDHS